MSIHTEQPMTDRHAPNSLAVVAETLHLWRDRFQQRTELSHWSERDMHDVGLSLTEVMAEAEKPFWRA
ncbi:MAG: DUF1127 domain-containing protein [Tardiphaga sp.]